MPSYEPWKWNDDEEITESNNCYNYACDMITGTFAQPGQKNKLFIGDCTCDEVSAFSIEDGLQIKLEDKTCPDSCWAVALFIAPDGPFGLTYHWYRQDSDGTWSHKYGKRPATNLDESTNIITDPTKADRGDFTRFCGYYSVCKDKVNII